MARAIARGAPYATLRHVRMDKATTYARPDGDARNCRLHGVDTGRVAGAIRNWNGSPDNGGYREICGRLSRHFAAGIVPPCEAASKKFLEAASQGGTIPAAKCRDSLPQISRYPPLSGEPFQFRIAPATRPVSTPCRRQFLASPSGRAYVVALSIRTCRNVAYGAPRAIARAMARWRAEPVDGARWFQRSPYVCSASA